MESLRAAQGFWPKGWELAWLDAERLGVKCGGSWIVSPRSSPRMLEMEALSRIQAALDSQTKAVGLTALALAEIHGVAILRERMEVADCNGRRVEFFGRRLSAMHGGRVVAGPTEHAAEIERAIVAIANGAAIEKAKGGSLAGLVFDDVPVDEARTTNVPRA